MVRRKAAESTEHPAPESTIATQEAPAREPGDESERKPFPPIREWAHDNVAGVQRLSYSNKETKRYETWIKFRDGKPSDQVRQFMKEHGFQWHGDVPEAGVYKGEGAWTHPIGYTTGAQDRMLGENVYRGVVDLIRKEKGIEGQEASRF